MKAAGRNGEASPQWVGNVSTVSFIRFYKLAMVLYIF